MQYNLMLAQHARAMDALLRRTKDLNGLQQNVEEMDKRVADFERHWWSSELYVTPRREARYAHATRIIEKGAAIRRFYEEAYAV